MRILVNSILLFLISTQSHALSKTLTISYVEKTQLSFITQIVLIEAYQKLGIELKFKSYPGWRALKTASEGKVDGELHRISGLTKKFPNLIQILPSVQRVT